MDPDNMDPEYRPEITSSENWPGTPWAVMTIGTDGDNLYSTISVARHINVLQILQVLVGLAEKYATESAGMGDQEFLPSSLRGAKLFVEALIVKQEQEYNE